MRARWISAAALVLFPSALFPPLALADPATAWGAYRRHAYGRALNELRPLAERGDARAQYFLGSIYLDGAAVKRSAATAAGLFQRAAASGYAPAQFALGLLLYYGSTAGDDRLAADPARALPWLEKAAAAGIPLANQLVGEEFAAGGRLPPDTERAKRHLAYAANAGLVGAQAALGVLLGAEPGVQHAMEAYKWLTLAAAANYPGAAQNLEALAPRLNADERAAVKAAAQRFTPTPPPVVD